jgi:hypothetical protein
MDSRKSRKKFQSISPPALTITRPLAAKPLAGAWFSVAMGVNTVAALHHKGPVLYGGGFAGGAAGS